MFGSSANSTPFDGFDAKGFGSSAKSTETGTGSTVSSFPVHSNLQEHSPFSSSSSSSASQNPLTFAAATNGETNANPDKEQTVEQVISLKVVIEKKNKKVLFVEGNKDFVDVIFGFLTLPIGSILRLVEGIFPLAVIGCLSNIYASVGNLNVGCFRTEACKQMLLQPRISSKAYLNNLKLKIEGEKATAFYFCQNEACRTEGKARLSEFSCFRCHCGQLMDRMATLVDPVENATTDNEGGAFIREGIEVFLVCDDMQIVPGMASVSMFLLKQFGIREVNELEIRHVDVGNKQIVKLLWLILVSQTPLTNWIFEDDIFSKTPSTNWPKLELPNIIEPVNKGCAMKLSQRMSLTLFFCKSMKKVLYAECREEFVDFLFSFLTFPLGSVSKVLDGISQVVCLENIYESVGDLSARGYFKSEEAKNMLFCPRLPPHVAYKNNPLQIEEMFHPLYLLLLCAGGSKPGSLVVPLHTLSSDIILEENTELVSVVVNPKSCDDKATCNGGFIKGHVTFMITDELVITLLSPAASISFIGELNLAITDIEEVTVEVGEEEAKNILRAALLSKTALTDVFSRTCLDQLEFKEAEADVEVSAIAAVDHLEFKDAEEDVEVSAVAALPASLMIPVDPFWWKK